MNADDMLEETTEHNLLRTLMGNRRLTIIFFSAFIFASALYGAYDARADELQTKRTPGDLKEASYPEAGLTTAGINLGYWYKRYGLRLSQYYLNENRTGMMLNLGYTLSDNEKTQKSINFLAGRYAGSDSGADYDYTYAGIAYALNFSIRGYRGFFFELGMAAVLQDNLGNLADDPIVPCANIGYIYRFTSKNNN
jgi:hypothetical protein